MMNPLGKLLDIQLSQAIDWLDCYDELADESGNIQAVAAALVAELQRREHERMVREIARETGTPVSKVRKLARAIGS